MCAVVSRQDAALPSEVPHPIEALVEEGDSLPLVGPEVSRQVGVHHHVNQGQAVGVALPLEEWEGEGREALSLERWC